MIGIEHPSSFASLDMGTEFSQDLYRQGSKRDLRLVQPEGQPKLFDERVSCILLFPNHDNILVPLLVQLMYQYLKRRCFQLSSYGTIARLRFSLAGRVLPVLLRSKMEYEAFFPLQWTYLSRMRLPTKQTYFAWGFLAVGVLSISHCLSLPGFFSL